MSTVSDQLEAALTAIQAAQADVASAEPSLADNVLAAVTPVLEAGGWTAPTNTTTDSTDVPVSTDTPPAA